ncbi:23S rRNA (uracil(1939)-C(5))-methyltransferase RlmD [Alloalcanivorax profundimaris]|uniref:23S rRNA (uracil(1939)-C(5))-methyltransferase RlmD n=1 Tax=Alloalcanivorax profundimaris TaxID=2735259 RepID=UPI000C65E0EB|nr:23S rRNA (uracil(1939)-C(5))-methyltransferase RlmD [Alloalcanivorax profundimaris]MAO61211.1 23S rRNA (uracil(1939)-C(5))-methyltransferase RlmD [Alcanivorax sp.]MBM1143144.1 23S rRNA (uracil(1939)-C(5))-methyltransferase RlmD [Alcanivorax sp. ZXX171]MAY10731.1 23S rRNA (uracil(1939)-C(5))-methyltransferase RlmD [Alcanivorax sp.]MBF1803742.1 23S rRNA (uracil(1939)-C(5))-methyltransferase RlmD [Alloalcanivorax profundimaris]MBI53404.1 23S rRNA (uracil(1939)-C(5))-methyltransferase RlmD [Alc|tara:strand:+ start:133636 stop:134982 length:1347 start_codon:yes stop_codon:yes gene_type:complete
MGRRRKKKLPEMPVAATIESLSHDGRGIARLDGKTTFIDNALPGEQVFFQYTYMRRKFDEGRAVEILEASPDRVEPPCAHALICGGCSLQHVAPASQIRRKEAVLAEQLAHFGGLQPESWLAPLTGPVTGYRGKARMGAKFIDARGETLVGFREKRNSFIADLHRCEVLIPEVGHRLDDLRALMDGLESRHRIPQIEVARGDDAVALVFRHLDPLPAADLAKLVAFCQDKGLQLYLQPGNESTVHRVWPEQGEERLYYRHAPHGPDTEGAELAFHPTDFTQVNAEINRRMVPLALDLLEVEAHHQVLDLFCGLGNFTIPAARRAARVVGVEGSDAMVERGYENARRNDLENLEFHAWDLSREPEGQPWARQAYHRVLLDPPRSGALEMVRLMPHFGADRLVYVSCNPATLARDAGELVARGYRLKAAGVMDMFPHTAHVESIAVFDRR